MGYFADLEFEKILKKQVEFNEIQQLSDLEIVNLMFDAQDEDGDFHPERDKINSICDYFKIQKFLTRKQRDYLNYKYFEIDH